MGNTPRRLARFYRNGEEPIQNQNQENSAQKEVLSEDPFAPNGRPLLKEIPSMGYEDLTDKNFDEIKKMEQENLEQKIALEEIEKFKKENNRMPTKQESDLIAENIFSQLKNKDMNSLYPESAGQENTPGQTNQRGHRGRRGDKEEQIQKQQPASFNSIPSQNENTNQINDMPGLLSEDSPKKDKKKGPDEFDLGLDSDLEGSESEEIGSIEDNSDIENISLDDKQDCPYCKKETDHIVYCPKCGSAYCEKCGKKQGLDYTCPKCGTKTKA